MSTTSKVSQDNFDDISFSFCDTANERSVLSLMAHDESSFFSVLSKISPRDFLAPESKAFFEVLSLLNKMGYTKFDKLLLTKTAKDLNCEAQCSESFIDAMMNLNLSMANMDKYIAKLIDDSTKFQLYSKLKGHSLDILDNARHLNAKSSDDLINHVQADMLSLSLNSNAIEEPMHISDGLDDYIASIADERIETIGISTGYPILDKLIDGLVPGTLTVIAARKKMGKSTMLTNIATNVAVNDGLPVLYLDTEMTFKEWRDRVLAIISGVRERTIKHGGFKHDKAIYERVIKAVEYLKKSKLFHHYIPGYTLDNVSALYKKYKFKEDMKLAIFDYIKEPDSSSTESGRKEHQILGDVTTRLKDLSGQLDVPFLAAVQLNRSGDVADSDRVARYGDVVAFWGLRDIKKAEEEKLDLDIIGHYGLSIKDSRRGGSTGELGIGYKFLKTKLKILEVPQMDQAEQFDYLDDKKIDLGDAVNAAGLADENII